MKTQDNIQLCGILGTFADNDGQSIEKLSELNRLIAMLRKERKKINNEVKA